MKLIMENWREFVEEQETLEQEEETLEGLQQNLRSGGKWDSLLMKKWGVGDAEEAHELEDAEYKEKAITTKAATAKLQKDLKKDFNMAMRQKCADAGGKWLMGRCWGDEKSMNESEVKFAGILKTTPTEAMGDLQKLAQGLPEEAVLLPEEKWHVTLVHQSILKPFSKELKLMELPPAPAAKLIPEVEERIEGEKRSWVVWLENQEEMKAYVNQLMEMLGGQPDPEPERRFHVSLANLTGQPGDSVG